MKIANDARWLASGPRCGIGELIIPANEPGSSIMPGKVNPPKRGVDHGRLPSTAMTLQWLLLRVKALELNVYKPVMIHNLLESAQLIADGCESFRKNCAEGIEPSHERIEQLLHARLCSSRL